MSKKAKISRLVLSFFLIFITSLVLYYNHWQIRDYIKEALIWQPLCIVISIIFLCVNILNSVFTEKFFQNFDISNFKKFFYDLVSWISEPAFFLSSFTVLRALFLDYYYEESFFTKFSSTEKIFITTTSMWFLILSVMDTFKTAKKIIVIYVNDNAP